MADSKLEFQTFVGKAPVITAVEVTEDNLDDIAEFVRAAKYTITKSVKDGSRLVEFYEERENNHSYPRMLVRVLIGGYILTWPEGVNDFGGSIDERAYGVEKEDIERFVAQKMNNEPIDPDSIPDHNGEYRTQF